MRAGAGDIEQSPRGGRVKEERETGRGGPLRLGVHRRSRDDIAGDPSVILTHSGGILSLETSPNGTIYFSDFGAIYKLVFS